MSVGLVGQVGRVGVFGARLGAAGPLLDLPALSGLTVVGAYSLQKIRAAYSGSAIRVRRSSDNAEQDVGFAGNALDTASMLTFVGANDGFVTTWYDQSGNTRNQVQATAGSQPRIVNAGAYLGAIIPDAGTAQRLVATDAAFGLASSELTIASALQASAVGSSAMGLIWGLGTVAAARIYPGTAIGTRDLINRPSGSNIAASPAQTLATGKNILTLTKTTTASLSAVETRVNGSAASTYSASAIGATDNTFGINNTTSTTVAAAHEHQEHVVFSTLASADQIAAIQINMAARWGVTLA